MKAIRLFGEIAYSAQIAGVSPAQIDGVKSKDSTPIKFIKTKPGTREEIEKDIDGQLDAD